MSDKDRLYLEAGEDTEQLINFIFQNLPDSEVDEIDLYRSAPANTGVAREPITTSAILACSSTMALSVLKLVRLWMEHRRQDRTTKFIYDAAQVNPEAAKLLAQLEKEHSKVSIEFEKVRLPEFKKP